MTDFTGTSSDDNLSGTNKSDNLSGGAGDDTLYGMNGNDILDGGEGDDYLDGGNGQDILFGNAGNDTLIGLTGTDLLFGGSGNDQIGSSSTTLTNDTGTDTIYGDGYQSYQDYLDKKKTTNYGNDMITGGNGVDVIYGDSGFNDDGGGNDVINAGNGNDSIYGEGGNDVLAGESGNDGIDGGAGDDVLNGGDGSDVLIGGSGDDILIGGTGTDILTGGDGTDTYVITPGDAGTQDTITDFVAGEDTLDITPLLSGDVQWGYTDPTAYGIWFNEGTDGNTYIHVDTDGDTSTSEVIIKVDGIHNFSNQDFAGSSNEAPVNVTPDTQTLGEDQTLTFATATGNAITISDADRNTTLTVTLTATHGTLTLLVGVGVTGLDSISGDGTYALVLVGAPNVINTALEGLVYTADANYNGPATITVESSDGFVNDVDTINLAINAVNDAPINTVSMTQDVNEDTILIFSSANGNALSVNDSTDTSQANSTDWLSTTVSVLHGTMMVASGSGATVNNDVSNNVTISGTAAQINAALEGLRYAPTTNYNGGDTLTIVTNDGGYNNHDSGGVDVLGDTKTVAITVNAVNDAPVNTVSTAQTTNEDTALIFSTINGNALNVSDSTDTNEGNSTNWLSTTVSVAHGRLTVASSSGVSISNDGSASVTISGTAAQINAALDGLTYAPTGNYNGGDTLTIVTDDGGYNNAAGVNVLSDTKTVAITVNAVNDAPVNTVSTAQTTNEDTVLIFSTTNGNALNVSDSTDTNEGNSTNWLSTTVSVAHGRLTVASSSGVSINNDGSASVTISGTAAQINAALDGLTYAPTGNYNGGDTLTIVTDDGGYNNAAGVNVLSDTKTVAITINPVNDAPVLDTSKSPQLNAQNEDAGAPSGAVGTLVSILVDTNPPAGGVNNVSDVDNGASLGIALTGVNSTNGTWWYSTNNGAGWAQVGTVSDINALLLVAGAGTRLYFQSNANWNGPLTNAITLRAWDQTSGTAGTKVSTTSNGETTAFSNATDTAALTINSINDAPIANSDSNGTDSVIEASYLVPGDAGAVGNVLTNDTDVDVGESKTVVGVAAGSVSSASGNVGTTIAGVYGTLTLGSNGAWNYALNNGDPDTNALAQNEQATDVFTYTMRDAADATSTSALAIRINGSNDAPTITNTSFALAGKVKEDVTLAVSGQLSANDVDQGSSRSWCIVGSSAGSYGGILVDNTGKWTYSLANGAANVQALNEGEKRSDSFTIRVTDDKGAYVDQAVNIGVWGTNDVRVGEFLVNDSYIANTQDAPSITGLQNGGFVVTWHSLSQDGDGWGIYGQRFNAYGNKVGGLFRANTYTASDEMHPSATALKDGGFIVAWQSNHHFDGSWNIEFQRYDAYGVRVGYETFATPPAEWPWNYHQMGPSITGLTNGGFVVTWQSDRDQDGSAWGVFGRVYNSSGQLVSGDFCINNNTYREQWGPAVTGLKNGGFVVSWTAYTYGNGTTPDHSNYYDIFAKVYNNNGTALTGEISITNRYWDQSYSSITALDNGNFVVAWQTANGGDYGLAGTDVHARIFDQNGNALGGGWFLVSTPYNYTGGTDGEQANITVTALGNGGFVASWQSYVPYSILPGSTDNEGWAIYGQRFDAYGNKLGGEFQVNTSVSGDQANPSITSISSTKFVVSWYSNGDIYSRIYDSAAPAGTAGQPIQLGIGGPTDTNGDGIAIVVNGLPADWTLSEGERLIDGSWQVTTTDPSALTVTPPVDFQGAILLDIGMAWTNADGTLGSMTVWNNVEAYTPGSPVFAWSGDDHLTGSTGSDTFVFGQPIGGDFVYNFNSTADTVDLMGFSGFASFADVQAHLSANANGDAVLNLADGQTITFVGVDPATLGADNFAFNENPVTNNAGTITIGDGAMLPLGGVVDNTGTIALNAAGQGAIFQIIANGMTLQGGGQVMLSDDDGSLISGTTPDISLTNVDNTISGAGQIGGGQMSLDNQGSINANGVHALVIDIGTNEIVNSGTLESSGSGGLNINSTLSNSGLLWANGSKIIVNGAVSGSGSVLFDGASSIEFRASLSNNVVFANAAAGTLRLIDSDTFMGTVAGWNADDVLDLLDMDFSSVSFSYTVNATDMGGTLTVTDGVDTANITLIGQYTNNGFLLATGAMGGTAVTYADEGA